MTTAEQTGTAEALEHQVFDWRFTELLRAGFTHDQARRLASSRQVDIRTAERLLDDGCPPETAARILL